MQGIPSPEIWKGVKKSNDTSMRNLQLAQHTLVVARCMASCSVQLVLASPRTFAAETTSYVLAFADLFTPQRIAWA
jgi:hypothetical protein